MSSPASWTPSIRSQLSRSGSRQRLVETECPVGVLDPRVEPRVYERDDFTVTLWTFYVPVTHREVAPADYASCTCPVAPRHAGSTSRCRTSPIEWHRPSRSSCAPTSRRRSSTQTGRFSPTRCAAEPGRSKSGAPEQLLHGEPHPGNLLDARHGFRFIDLETCCRGPVEFDLAHVPEAVVRHYPDVDEELLVDCRVLVLATVAAWRWEPRRPTPERCASRARPRERAAQRPALAHARRPHGRLACRRSKVAVTPPSDRVADVECVA